MSSASSRHRRYRAADPRRKAIGWGVVVAVHALLGWALVSGTARESLQSLSKPMQAAVIQEVTIPPPPPPPKIVETPKRVQPPKAVKPKPVRPRPVTPKVVAPKAPEPPPAFVPPPEVAPPPSPAAVQVPSMQTPATSSGSAPAGPPAPAEKGTGAGPSRSEMGVACPTQVKPEMPRKALREGIEGVVKAQALIRNGVVKEVTILSGPSVYHKAVRDAMLQYKCISGPGDVLATQEFVFKIE